MHKDVESILVSEEKIRETVAKIGLEINHDLNGEPLLVIVI